MCKKAYIHTFGCQMNVHDSEKISGQLLGEGYTFTEVPNEADLIIFNTCGIRQKAEQKFRSELGRAKLLKRKKPSLKIAVAGCIAQQQGSLIFKKNPQVDYVFGPQNISKLKSIIRTEKAVLAVEDNPEIEHDEFSAFREDRVKALVSIMYGCNNFCSYCIVPYTRGRERSRSAKDICSEVNELASRGFKEVTLLGQNVSSYKSEDDFPGLLKKIDNIKGLERIRFVTSHPRDMTEDLIKCIKALPGVCEHIHLPLQSASDRILKLMNRGYTYADYIEKVVRLREEIPGIAITTDIIVGFPSESAFDHDLTVNALKSIEFDGIFAFKFSSRPGTKAAEMTGMVQEIVKSQRLTEILNLQDEITLKRNKLLEGTVQEVLIEGHGTAIKGNMTAGRTRTNKIINLKGRCPIPGFLVNVRIIKAMRHSLDAELLT